MSGCSGPRAFSLILQSPLVQGQGLVVGAHSLIQFGQIVEADGGVGVLRPQGLFPDLRRPLVEGLGLVVGAQSSVYCRARLLRLVAVRGCSGPRAFSMICKARW